MGCVGFWVRGTWFVAIESCPDPFITVCTQLQTLSVFVDVNNGMTNAASIACKLVALEFGQSWVDSAVACHLVCKHSMPVEPANETTHIKLCILCPLPPGTRVKRKWICLTNMLEWCCLNSERKLQRAAFQKEKKKEKAVLYFRHIYWAAMSSICSECVCACVRVHVCRCALCRYE